MYKMEIYWWLNFRYTYFWSTTRKDFETSYCWLFSISKEIPNVLHNLSNLTNMLPTMCTFHFTSMVTTLYIIGAIQFQKMKLPTMCTFLHYSILQTWSSGYTNWCYSISKMFKHALNVGNFKWFVMV